MKRIRDDILNPDDESGNRMETSNQFDNNRQMYPNTPLMPPPLVPMDSFHMLSHSAPVAPLPTTAPSIPLNPLGMGGSLNYPLPNPTAPVAYPQPVATNPLQQQQAMNRQVKFENALDFLDQVKLQFAKQPRVYNQFLDIMKDFKAQNIDTPGVIARVKELFAGHGSLIYGFNTFLPPGYKIELDEIEPDKPIQKKQQPEFNHARNYVKKIKQRFNGDGQVYKDFLEILYSFNRENSNIKEVYDQIAVLFKDHQDLLDEFSQFLPDPMQTQQQSRQRVAKKPPPNRPATIPAKRPSAQRAVDMMKRQASDEEAPGAGLGATYEELEFFNRVKNELGSRKLYHEFLKCINLFSQEIITKGELITLVRDLLPNQEIFDWFKNFIGYDEAVDMPVEKQKQPPVILVPRATYEIDYSTCRRCGPSYRALPRSFQVPFCSGRTEADKAVLNDTWVSVATGSEDFSFRASRKNDYEEELFKCEDDRFELDLLIEQNQSTIRALEPLLKSIQAQPELKTPALHELLDSQLDILHLRSIERLYSERGPDVVEAMYANPAGVIPILLARLRDKDHDLTQDKVDSNKVWKKIFEQNYARSLDHQSFYFKQNEKKNLSAKILVAEIKQEYSNTLRDKSRRRKQQEEEEMKPHLKLEYSAEPDVLDDIIELLLCAGDKVMSKGDREKYEPFLTRFLKSLLTEPEEPKEASHKRKEVITKPTTRIFFGSTPFYLVFRLLNILIQRLQHARVLSETEPGKYDKLKEHIVKLLTTDTDTTAFEDQCRTLYGIEAYTLFTLDKLLTTITRHTQSIFGSEASTKLITFYEVEQERPYGLNRTLYYQNVADLLQEDRCFHFEFSKGTIGISLLDDTYHPAPTFQELDIERWTEYVKAYVQPAAGEAKHRVFLARTVNKKVDPSSQCIVQNGLEARMLLKSYRMFYVENTEDLFWRPGPRKSNYSKRLKIDALVDACNKAKKK